MEASICAHRERPCKRKGAARSMPRMHISHTPALRWARTSIETGQPFSFNYLKKGVQEAFISGENSRSQTRDSCRQQVHFSRPVPPMRMGCREQNQGKDDGAAAIVHK